MQNYSVMPMFMDHIDEIVEDIKLQFDKGIAVCPVFCVKVHPEGIPVIDKATEICEKFNVYKKKLTEKGLPAGFLVQSTLGHGYPLENPMPFTPFTSIDDGTTGYMYCPLDPEYRTYIKDVFKKLASCHPDVIMTDDDVRVLSWRLGHGGCACEQHMADFNKRAGTNMTRQELFDYIMSHPIDDEITLKWMDSQRNGVVGAVKAMREGIDEIDPTIQGILCNTGGDICEFAKDLAPILAGKGNPTIVRIGGGAYAPASTNCFSGSLSRVKCNLKTLENHVDLLLAEGDTLPFNRYGRNKSFYHSQMTMFTLHGCKGSKIWITYLPTYEPESDRIFREVLGDNMPFYNELIRIAPEIEWVGCNCPFELSDVFDFHDYPNTSKSWMFSMKVLERLGLPVYFSNVAGKASFLSGKCTKVWSDKFLNELFEAGSVFISSDCLEPLTERGFTDKIGVTCREWTGGTISGEMYGKKNIRKQIKQKELIPVNDKVYADSYSYRLENDKDILPLFPAVSVLPRENGKKTVVFAGTPDTEFNYAEAFSFLCKTRKDQLIALLKDTGALPVYYTEDAEIFLNAGYMGKDKMVLAPFNLGWDVLEDFPIYCEHDIKRIEKINPDGTYSDVEFTKDGENYVIKQSLGSMIPQVFILHI